MDFLELNLTGNATSSDRYIAIGVVHIVLVVIPSLILGPIILYLLALNLKKSTNSITILFVCITTICVVGPSTYGILMDISLITDVPLTGTCGTPSGNWFWILYTFSHTLIPVSTALLSITQYVTVRWGMSHLKPKRVLIIFLVLIIYTLLGSLTNAILDSIAPSIMIRGSLCDYTGVGIIALSGVVGLFLIAYVIPAFILVIIFSVLMVLFIKKNTIENKHEVKTALKITITIIISVVIFRLLPFATFVADIGDLNQFFFLVWLYYALDLSYPLFLVLVVITHKGVRKSFLNKLNKVISALSVYCNKNKVTPVVDSTQETQSQSQDTNNN